jgi:hypothetical protein
VICTTACREDARRREWGGPAAEGAEELGDRVRAGEVDTAHEGGKQGSSTRQRGREGVGECRRRRRSAWVVGRWEGIRWGGGRSQEGEGKVGPTVGMKERNKG